MIRGAWTILNTWVVQVRGGTFLAFFPLPSFQGLPLGDGTTQYCYWFLLGIMFEVADIWLGGSGRTFAGGTTKTKTKKRVGMDEAGWQRVIDL